MGWALGASVCSRQTSDCRVWGLSPTIVPWTFGQASAPWDLPQGLAEGVASWIVTGLEW